MCGIAGFISSKLTKHNLVEMCNCIAHRGPDADGFFNEEKIGLGHRRLSIIDLSEAANQPMYSAGGEHVIIFNGEIYNYQQLKDSLTQKGCVFQNHSDTEVVLQSFLTEGVSALSKFIGMFAFALYNRQTGQLLIVRDRVGVKPLYYYKKDNEFFFASELKAIAPQLPAKEINPDAVADFLRLGYITGEKTIYKNVYRLLPGHYIEADASGAFAIHKYWDIEDELGKPAPATEEDATDALESLMKDAFNYRMVADVPVGVFLSGGIDSSSLAAILAKDHSNLKTFSIGFDDARYNEAPYAKKIAGYLGTNHHEAILTASDAEKVMDQYFAIYDEPFADSSGIPVYLISQFAKDNGCKVVLSADGGDELFAGYDRYAQVPALYQKLHKRKMLLKVLEPAIGVAGAVGGNLKNIQHKTEKLSGLIDNLNGEFSTGFYESFLSVGSNQVLNNIIHSDFEKSTGGIKTKNVAPSEQLMLWDFKNYLPNDLLVKVDKASMATSIEAREPFLDHRLIEFAFNLPLKWRMQPDTSKYLLKKVLYRYIPKEHFDRPKMGFSIPLFKWFSQKLDKEFDLVFSHEVLSTIPILNKDAVAREYKKYRHFKAKGQEYNMLFIWHLYVFIKWWIKWML